MVVGAEHVSYSAILTLLESGVKVSALVTELPRHQTYGPAHWWVAGRNRIPLVPNSKVERVIGNERVSGVEIRDRGKLKTVECDTIVFTGDWIPDYEFCRTAAVPLNPHTKGPDTDQGLHTLVPGVFASGNILRGAETADVSSLEGTHAANSISRYLSGHTEWPSESRSVRIDVQDPIQWICPSRISADGLPPARNRFSFRVSSVLPSGSLLVLQADRILYKKKFGPLVPNRWYTLSWGRWASQIQAGVPLTVEYLKS